ncbi:MAG: S8 family serine peptidase, partial [Proteobacteria bacterium]|nr:S8 family serine peptidase [Pseudomonadota bacterium]
MILDIMTLSLFMLFSGGVVSGLGNFLILPVAFGGIMITGRLSSVIPAVAAISCFVCEFYVSIAGAQPDGDYFFQVALLGVAFFIVNIFFQYLIGKMKEKEQEVVSLETLNRMQQIAERSRMEMEDTAARFNALLTSAGEGVLGLNMEGRIIFSNPRACQLLDVDYGELMDRDIRSFMLPKQKDPNQPENVINLMQNSILDLLDIDTDQQFDLTLWQTANGDSFSVEYTCQETINNRKEKTGAIVLFQNVTEQRKNEERLQRLARCDPLTDLANRAYFSDALKAAKLASTASVRLAARMLVHRLPMSHAATDATIIAGLDWLAANANSVSPQIRVVNFSLGRPGTVNDNPALHAAYQTVVNMGIVVVVSAGNSSGSEISQQIPAAYSEVMAIASTTAADGNNKCKRFSGFVAADTASYFTTDGPGVAVSAPGAHKEDINKGCRVTSEGVLSLNLGGGTTRKSGTS